MQGYSAVTLIVRKNGSDLESPMTTLADTPARYGCVSRALHWGMAVLFAAQFLSAASCRALSRKNALGRNS